MKIASGDEESLIRLVKKRVDGRINEIETSLQKRMDEELSRAREHAKKIEEERIRKAKKTAEIRHDEIIRNAKQEAKQRLLKTKGEIEQNLRNKIREQINEFVQGKRKIDGKTYQKLVKNIIKKGKKKDLKFEQEKTDQGVILKSGPVQLDLTVESMLKILKNIPIQEEVKGWA